MKTEAEIQARIAEIEKYDREKMRMEKEFISDSLASERKALRWVLE